MRAHDEPLADRMLGPDELALREKVRRVVDAEVAPRAGQVDLDETFAQEGYRALAEVVGGIWAPVADGGDGRSTLAYAVAVEEVAAACPSVSTIYMTQMHAGYPILLAGSPAQRARFVPGLCRGDIFGSIAISETGAGSDAAALATTATRHGDHYVLNGSKTFITTANHAGVIVLFATVDRAAGPRGITAFCVEPSMPGFSTGRELSKLGMRGSATAEVFLDDCRVPLSSRLGSEGEGWGLLLRAVNKTRISASAQGVGMAGAAYAAALRWAGDRGALGREGTEAQALRFGLVDLRVAVLSARLLLYSTALLTDERPVADLTAEVSMTKLRCTDVAVEVAVAAMDLLGADGDRHDMEVERLARDAKVTQIYDGTNQIQRLIVGRHLDAGAGARPLAS